MPDNPQPEPPPTGSSTSSSAGTGGTTGKPTIWDQTMDLGDDEYTIKSWIPEAERDALDELRRAEQQEP